jgi:hypothetical protein
MILSGLLMGPFSLHTLLLEPQYWHPTRVAIFPIGPEDILIAFASGGSVWLISTWLVRENLAVNLNPPRMARRYLMGTLGGAAIGVICWICGASPLTATVITFPLFGLSMLWLGGRLWQLAVAGLGGFTAIYFALIKVLFMLSPGFVNAWNVAGLWGPRVLGVPLDEIVAAAGFGMAWPLFAAHLFDARLEVPTTAGPNRRGGRRRIVA